MRENHFAALAVVDGPAGQVSADCHPNHCGGLEVARQRQRNTHSSFGAASLRAICNRDWISATGLRPRVACRWRATMLASAMANEHRSERSAA